MCEGKKLKYTMEGCALQKLSYTSQIILLSNDHSGIQTNDCKQLAQGCYIALTNLV